MHFNQLMSQLYITAFVLLNTAIVAKATMFVVSPLKGSSCHAGQPCTVTWLDDGNSPLVTALGVCAVGLYTGKQQLVQSIKPVDVGSSQGLKFTPIAKAGADSDAYYVGFSCPRVQVNGSAFLAYSPFFKLDGMTGSFSSPDPAAISTFPLPPQPQPTPSPANPPSSQSSQPNSNSVPPPPTGFTTIPFTPAGALPSPSDTPLPATPKAPGAANRLCPAASNWLSTLSLSTLFSFWLFLL